MTCQQSYYEYCGGVISTSKDTGLAAHTSRPDLPARGATTNAPPAPPDQLRDAEGAARERVPAWGFLVGSNRIRYGKLLKTSRMITLRAVTITRLHSLQQAYYSSSLVMHWKQDPRNVVLRLMMDGINDGVAFTNVGSEGLSKVPAAKGKGRRKPSEIMGYKCCGEKGHTGRTWALPNCRGRRW
jgi:hypothetical protein